MPSCNFEELPTFYGRPILQGAASLFQVSLQVQLQHFIIFLSYSMVTSMEGRMSPWIELWEPQMLSWEVFGIPSRASGGILRSYS